MPKIVDADARRREVGEAVLRVVVRRGVDGASFSAIADEAGLAIGSVRHYFADHDAVLHFAMQELADRVGERMGRRIGALGTSDVDLAAVEEILAELLPLDDARRLEGEVWLEFLVAARTRPALSEVALRAATGIRSAVAQVLAGAARRGLIRIDDPAVETERLTSLLDGLTIGVVRPPGTDPATARAVLRRHLTSLAGD